MKFESKLFVVAAVTLCLLSSSLLATEQDNDDDPKFLSSPLRGIALYSDKVELETPLSYMAPLEEDTNYQDMTMRLRLQTRKWILLLEEEFADRIIPFSQDQLLEPSYRGSLLSLEPSITPSSQNQLLEPSYRGSLLSLEPSITPSSQNQLSEPSYRGRLRSLEHPMTPFRQDQLSEITSCSKQIYSQTGKEDVVVFLGRSPLWLAEFWKYKNVDRNFFTLAFSGDPFNTLETIPIAEQLEGYEIYLDKIGFVAATKSLKGKLIVVDYYSCGSSICCFYKTLNNLYGQTEHGKNLLKTFTFYKLTNPYAAERTLAYLHEAKIEHRVFFEVMQLMMNHHTLIPIADCYNEESLGVDFPFTKWNQVDPLAQIPSEKAVSLQNQLHQYWENERF